MPAKALSLTASAANLRRLTIIRTVLILALLASLSYVKIATDADLINPSHLIVPALLALINVLTHWRLRQGWPVTDVEFFLQLLVDVLGLTLILYLSGGATNPFISYYLVPITIAAALLPRRYTWAIAAISLGAYTLMLFYYKPLPQLQMDSGMHAHHSTGINLHIFGMWLTFALSAVLISQFVALMAAALRQRDQQQANNREQALHNEQILAVATLAAGTAHEMGTPLSTMTILLDELSATCGENAALQQDLAILKEQVNQCRHTLSGLVATADVHSQSTPKPYAVKPLLLDTIERWQLLRPEIELTVDIAENLEHLSILTDATLQQAFTNVLNNAADAAHTRVHVCLRLQHPDIVVTIHDDGPGIPLDIADTVGQPFFTTKSKGLGLGLFLSHATIQRCGGSIELTNHPDGGTMVSIRIPVFSEHNP